jgi:proteasome lid subunit RPN8/RPN11
VSAPESGSIRVATAVLEAIIAHARAEAPRECCGLLLGSLTEIRRAEPARNLSPQATRYDLDPTDHFRILRLARAEGLDVIGAYHSHPASAPVPSPTDLYLIATLRPEHAPASLERGIRAYYFEGATFREIRLLASV